MDDDEIVCKQADFYLREIGITEIDMCHNGHDAWQMIKTKDYAAVVLDWKLPQVSGLALFNRLRRLKRSRTTPVLVISGLVDRDDFRIISEFPCTGLIEKPFNKASFQNKVGDLLAESRWFVDNVDLMDSLAKALLHDEKRALELLKKNVIDDAPNPLPIVALAAKRLRAKGALKAAAKLLKNLLVMEPRSIIGMSELGKVLHLLGRHKEAMTFLRAAHLMSPQNVGRLCLMGEVELNLCEPENAKIFFKRALDIDEDDPTALRGVEVADDMATIIESPEADHIPHTFAGLLNVIGINMVRTGNFAKGIEKYRAALKFLHVKDSSARVAFNLGLGYLRWGKASEALEWFLKAQALGKGTFTRPTAYVSKLRLVVPHEREEASEPLEFKTSTSFNLSFDERRERKIEIPEPLMDAITSADFQSVDVIGDIQGAEAEVPADSQTALPAAEVSDEAEAAPDEEHLFDRPKSTESAEDKNEENAEDEEELAA